MRSSSPTLTSFWRRALLRRDAHRDLPMLFLLRTARREIKLGDRRAHHLTVAGEAAAAAAQLNLLDQRGGEVDGKGPRWF